MSTYTVQPKNPDADPHDYQAESLEDVAGKVGVSVDELYQHNAGTIGSSPTSELTVGTTLIVPQASEDPDAQDVTPDQAGESAGDQGADQQQQEGGAGGY